MATEPTDSDFVQDETTTTQYWDVRWPEFARMAQGLRAIWNAVEKGGASPDDHVETIILGDGTNEKRVRLKGVATTNAFDIEVNTGTDEAPNWTTRIFRVTESGGMFASGDIDMSDNDIFDIRSLTTNGAVANDFGGGGVSNTGTLTGVTGITLTSGNVDLAAGDIINPGAFTGTVGGVAPVVGSDLATKTYVDTQDVAFSQSYIVTDLDSVPDDATPYVYLSTTDEGSYEDFTITVTSRTANVYLVGHGFFDLAGAPTPVVQSALIGSDTNFAAIAGVPLSGTAGKLSVRVSSVGGVGAIYIINDVGGGAIDLRISIVAGSVTDTPFGPAPP